MKPSLELNLGQQLKLTPQLRQAIRLLQLSTIDLQQEIQSIVESNPMLEATANKDQEPAEANQNTDRSDDLKDFQWSSIYSTARKANNFNESDYNIENAHSTTTTLREHLTWQLNLTPMSDEDYLIAANIIDAINDDGILTVSKEELQKTLSHPDQAISQEQIEAVRHRIQRFDPIGCGSYCLSDCLITQLQSQYDDIPHKELTQKILREDIQLLGRHNYREIKKKYQISDEILDQILHNIHQLTPKPGSLIHQTSTEYVIPDLIAKKVNGHWEVRLNQTVLPRLNINQQYASLINHTKDKSDNLFLKNNLQEARWFLKSIKSRQETLLNVGKSIIDYQKDFLENGEESMRPLILSDVANMLDMHESTISRVTTQKYIHTPRGVFELKYFFSSHVNADNGGECSSTAIRATIKKLIDAENRNKPLSDNKLAQLIKEQGINIARRTVSKYREAMGIVSSHERKEL